MLKPAFFAWVLSFASAGALATPPALDSHYQLDLDDHRGKTFLATMLDEDGIVVQMNADYSETEYEFPTWQEVDLALKNFDKKNINRVMGVFKTKEAIRKFTLSQQGKTFSPSNIHRLLGDVAAGRNLISVGHFFAMAGGAGQLVKIDENNYFYNVGYKLGNGTGDERSGRSYAASPVHPANDVSHKRYLQDLEQFLEGSQDRLFYTVMMQILTNTDDSDFSKLTDLGESVGTDFVAVYVAELRRHLMADLNPRKRPWANDYAEVTFVSAYGSAAGGKLILKVTDNRGKTVLRLQEAPMWKWWELNPATGRSGIGKTQRERRILQRHISDYMRENHGALVSAVQEVTGERSDVFQGVMEFLNNFKTRKDLGKDAERLTESFVDFLMQVQEDADAITDYIYGEDESLIPRSGDRAWSPEGE